jgi:hypothetical protein
MALKDLFRTGFINTFTVKITNNICIALESPACTERDIEEYNDCSNERNNNKNLPIPVC